MGIRYLGAMWVSGFTVTELAGAAENDVFVAVANSTSTSTIVPPSGWTNLYNGTSPNIGVSGSSFQWTVDYIVRGASAPSLTWTGTGAASAHYIAIVAFRGVDTSNPIDATSSSGSTGTNNSAPNPPSVTTVTEPTALVSAAIHASFQVPSSLVAPAGFSMIRHHTIMRDHLIIGVAGGIETIDPGTVTGGAYSSGDYWNGFTIALREASVTPAPDKYLFRRDP